MKQNIIRNADIIAALEAFAPLARQESYDNCGLTVGRADDESTGVLLTVDVTPEVVREAADMGFNLIVAHHPVIFRGFKSLTGASRVEESVIEAVRSGISIYSCHTCLDNTPGGVSWQMAQMLGLNDVHTLDAPEGGDEVGCGAVGSLPISMSASELVENVKLTFDSPMARCSIYDLQTVIHRVAMCGGTGSFLIEKAIASGAQAFITSDTKYHDFTDYANRILIIDIGHHESENCTKDIFYRVITEKFPNFAVRKAKKDINPIIYL